MLHNLLQFCFAGATVLSILAAWIKRPKRAAFIFAAIAAACAAVAAHYDVFWAVSVFGLCLVWALFCATNFIDLAWRVKTGFVIFLALGSVLCIYPTYHDERFGVPQDDPNQTAEQKTQIENQAKRGDLGWSQYLLSNIPFRLVRGLD